MPIEIIRPAIFNEQEPINAFVTLKNADSFSDNRNIPGLNLGFNTKESAEVIRENRQTLFRTFDLDEEWIAFGNQVHGANIKAVSGGGTFPETDGLITQIPELSLAIQIADCSAILIAEASAKMIAAVHAGWRGAAGGIIFRAAEK